MAVPYTFGSATSSIPLSQLDSNFATTITLGNTAIQLGNTVTTLNDMTLANVSVTQATFTSNVVVSVTDNTNAALRITQLGTGNALLVEDVTNPDATPVAIDANGTVLVGITTAQTIEGITPAYQQLGGNNYAAMWLGRYSANNTANAIYLTKSRSGTVGTNTIVQTNDDLGTIAFYGADGTNLISAATILGEVDSAPSLGVMPGRLTFSTTNSTGTLTERMRINSNGNLGLGTATITNTAFRNSVNITGSTTSYAMFVDSQVQSGVTSSAVYYSTSANTAVASFTVNNIKHYRASQATLGAGSTVTSQYGFVAEDNLTGATNNYGFYGDIASGTGRYNFYAAGTADNYFAGDVGIGTTTPVTKLEVAGSNNITWSVTASITGTTMDVTAVTTSGIAVGDLVFGANIQTYTRVTALGTGTGGVGTYTVSVSQTAASGSVTGGATYGNLLIRITDTDTTQNIGQPNGGLQFYTSDASAPTAGVGAYVAAVAEDTSPDTALVFGTRDDAGGGIDANERMRLNSVGNLILGYLDTVATTNHAATAITPLIQIQGGGASPSSAGLYNWSTSSTSSSTLAFSKSVSNTIGTRGAVATGADLGNIAFAGDDGTNFVTAAAILAEVDGTVSTGVMPGVLSFLTTPASSGTPVERLRITANGRIQINGSNTFATTLVATANAVTIANAASLFQFRANATPNAANTANVGFGSDSALPATGAFGSNYGFLASTIATGGATLTNNYGFYAQSQTVGTNIYGVYSEIASATGRYNFYAAGTADNYMAGNVGIGVTSPTAVLNLKAGTATASTSPLKFTSGTNLTSVEAGAVEYDGNVFYGTADVTSGRGLLPTIQYFRLTADGSAITTIANFFGGTSGITLDTSTFYEVEYNLFFTKTTAGTATFTMTFANAPINNDAWYVGTPVGGVGTAGTAQTAAIVKSTATAGALPATGTLTTAVNHQYTVKAMFQANATTGGTLNLQATSSAGSITPLIGSYYKITRLPAVNTGAFV